MTETSNIAGGARNEALAMVSADQDTILGNGTTEDPLRAADAGDQTFTADTVGETTYRLGQPQIVVNGAPTFGVAIAQPADATGGDDLENVVGLVVDISEDPEVPTVEVQYRGLIQLPASLWNAVTGGSGGLSAGSAYYLSTVVGQITTTPPAASGDFVVFLGVALNSTTLLPSLPGVAAENP